MVGTQIQHYRIISELGEGGMGKVFKAFDTKLERYVAIKFLNPNLIKDQLFLERFKTEGKNHAKLSHPNIAMVYGFIEHKNLIGLIIEFVDGVTLEYLIERYKRLNLIYSLKIVRQVLIALEYAHSKGLIHRDIKPSNIIIDKNGNAKLMDFGISKSVHSKTDLTRMGRNVGTILYMSPEQINNHESTPKTDLYSLAITLYEMLSGRTPYYFDNEYKIFDAHLNQIPEKLSSKFPDIPVEVDELILAAMNKSNTINYSSAVELRKAVEDLIFSLPVKINQISSIPQDNLKEKKRIGRGILIPFFLTLAIISLAGLSYIFVKSYIPLDNEKISERKNNFNSIKQNNKSDWQKIEINNAGNFTDIAFDNDFFYLSDDLGQVFVVNENFDLEKKSNLNLNFISRLLVYNDKIILFENDGKVIITSKEFKEFKTLNISSESILGADILGNTIVFCGSNGLIGNINLDNYNFSVFKNVPVHDYFDIKFINKNHLIAVGLNGIILQSNDGGQNWKKNNVSANYLKKIGIHPNKNLILLAGAAGTIYFSEDNGNNWNEIQLKVTVTVNDFLFFDINNFFAINSTGDFIYSSDGGKNWNFKKTQFYIPLNKITTDGKNLIIIGNNGLLLKKNI